MVLGKNFPSNGRDEYDGNVLEFFIKFECFVHGDPRIQRNHSIEYDAVGLCLPRFFESFGFIACNDRLETVFFKQCGDEDLHIRLIIHHNDSMLPDILGQ